MSKGGVVKKFDTMIYVEGVFRMLRIRIEFLTAGEHQAILDVLYDNFDVIECSAVRSSKIKNSKFKLQYITMVPKHEQ